MQVTSPQPNPLLMLMLMNIEYEAPHLTAMAHHGLEAVLCVQIPPLHKTVLGAAAEHTDTHIRLVTLLSSRYKQLKGHCNPLEQIYNVPVVPQLLLLRFLNEKNNYI